MTSCSLQLREVFVLYLKYHDSDSSHNITTTFVFLYVFLFRFIPFSNYTILMNDDYIVNSSYGKLGLLFNSVFQNQNGYKCMGNGLSIK